MNKINAPLKYSLPFFFVVFWGTVHLATLFAQPSTLPIDGPWNRDLYILESSDGLKFEKFKVFAERGGVPSLIQDAQGKLIAAFQWFPIEKRDSFDRVAVCFSSDHGKTWSDPESIVVNGLPEDYMRPFDPTLTLLEDGQIRLFFTSHHKQARTPAIYSAISLDGIHYTFEEGMRFGVDGEKVVDCAVTRLGKSWHLYVPIEQKDGYGYHAVSEDGLNFKRLEDVHIDGRHRWLGCALATTNGFRFYGSGEKGIWSAISTDGSSWKLAGDGLGQGADPGVAPTINGRHLMIVTGEPRKDSQSIQIDFNPFPQDAFNEEQRRKPLSSQPQAAQQRDGPWNHQILSATSKDGLTWKSDGKVIIEQASVPDAIVDFDGKTRIYFVDARNRSISVGIENTNGEWDFKRTDLLGADPNVILLKSGKYRVFLKQGREEGRIAYHDSEDGINFPNMVVIFDDNRYPQITDPDIFETPNGWIMYLSMGPRLLLAESKDGLEFRAIKTLDLGGSVSDTIPVNGGFRMFFHQNASPGQPMSIWSAFSVDGKDWKIEGLRLASTANSPDKSGVADPAVIQLKDDTYRMFYKSFIK